MKVKHRHIFNTLKAKGVYPLTTTLAKYSEAVTEVVLEAIGHSGASLNSERPLYKRVVDLSTKFAKNARWNWKKGHKSTKGVAFFDDEMEVIIYFYLIFRDALDFKSFVIWRRRKRSLFCITG